MLPTTKQIRITEETATRIKGLEIETTGVKLRTMDEKINFLLWFYQENIDKS